MGRYGEEFGLAGAWSAVLATAVVSLVAGVGYGVMQFVIGPQHGFFTMMRTQVLPQAVFDGLLAAPLYLGLIRLRLVGRRAIARPVVPVAADVPRAHPQAACPRRRPVDRAAPGADRRRWRSCSFSVLGFRLWFLQILSGDRYTALADNNRLRTVSIEAPRGVIYDRNGKSLVENRAGLSVGILPMDLRDEDIVLPRLATLLGIPEDEIRAKLEAAENDQYRVVIIKEDVPENTVVAFLKEHSLEFPGVRVEKSYQRDYGAAEQGRPRDPYPGVRRRDLRRRNCSRSGPRA